MFVDAEGGIEVLGYVVLEFSRGLASPAIQHGFVIMNATEIRL